MRRDAADHTTRLILAAVCALFAATAAAPEPAVGQEEGWNVEGDGDRRGKVVRRYKKLLEDNPVQGVVFKKLVEYVGKGDGLDRLIAEYAKKVEDHPDAVNYRLILGHLHKVENEYEKALKHYERAVELAPDRPVVWMSRGAIHRKLRNSEKARTDFEKALEQVDRRSRKQKILRKLADIAFRQQEWKRAETYYDRLIELDPRNEYLRQEYARVLVDHRRHEKALKQYEKLLELAGRNTKSRATTLRDMGDLYEKMGKDKKAVETYRRAMDLVRPSNWLYDALRSRVVEVYRANDRVADLLEEYESQWPRPNYDQALLLARLSDDVGREEQALEYLDRASRLGGGETQPLERKIDILRRRGADDEVLAVYRRLIEIAPNQSRYQFQLVRVYMQRGKRDRAVELLDRIRRRFRGQPDVFQKVAEAYLRYGMKDEALETYKRLVRIEPDNQSHIMSLGESYYRSGNIEKAVDTWKRLLDTSMPEARARSQLGQVFAEHGMIERGVRNYRKAVELQPDDMSIRRGLANTYERARRWSKAIEVWTHIMRHTDRPSVKGEARGRIISIYKRQHRLRSKLADFQKRFSSDPPDVEAGHFLAEGHLKLNNYEKAEKTYRQLVELDGTEDQEDIEALEALERIYRQTGDLEKAVRILQRLAKLRPKRQREYYHQIAELSLKLYENDQAVRYAALAVEKNPEDAEAHARLGEVYRKMHRLEAAAEEYRRAVQLDPKAHRHMMELAELALELGERERAEKLYREVVRKADDDSLVLDAARQAIDLAEQAGHLRELEREFSQLAFRGQGSHVYREVMLELYERIVTPLMLELRYGVGREREVLVERLAAIGARASPSLTAAIGSDDVGQRALAIRLLGGLREQSAALRLARIAVDETDSLRTLAAISVAEIGAPRAAGPLIGALDSSNPDIRELAAWTLGYVGGDRAQKALAKQLAEGQNWTQKALAALGLGRIGGDASAEALRRALATIPPGESNDRVLAAVAWALGRVGGEPAVDELVGALRRSPEDVQYVVASALARIGGEPSVRALLEVRWGDRNVLRAPAMRGLADVAAGVGREGSEDGGLGARYEQLSADTKHIDEREHRIEVAGLIDERRTEARLVELGSTEAFFGAYSTVVAEVAADRLRAANEADDEVVRVVLGDLWRSGTVHLGTLVPDSSDGRRSLVQALEVLRKPLRRLARSDRADVAASATGLLSRVGAAGVSRAVVENLSDDSASVRASAIRAFARSKRARSAWKRFKTATEDSNFAVRRAACAALAEVASRRRANGQGPGRTVELLEALLDDEYASVRIAAVRALGRVDGTPAAKAIASRLEDFELRVKVEALSALAGMESKHAHKAVAPYRDHSDYRLRRAASGGSDD